MTILRRRRPSRLPVREKEIENTILSYLRAIGIFAFKHESQGTFDQKLGIYRLNRGKMKGVADILGLLPGGRFLAIEVKSKSGRISPHQSAFLEEIASRGGLAFVARSIEDVEQNLRRTR